MKVAAIVLNLALLGALLHAQTSAPKPGTVDGTVTNSATGAPVKKAIVTLQPGRFATDNAGTSHATAISDASGHFHFDNVEPGSYDISVERDGFRGAGGGAFTGGEEQHVRDVAIELLPLGVVSGHVLDEDGDPIVRAQINVLQYVYGQGRNKQLTVLYTAQTNDLGAFEALNLAPGRYYFRVIAALPRNIPPHTRWAHPEEAYPVTFYPNASDTAQTTATVLSAGAHLSNIDFRLRKMPAYHIRGLVRGLSIKAGQAGQVAVTVPDSNSGGTIAQAALQPDGTFDVRGVVNGSYEVSYVGQYYAYQAVRVSDADVNGVAFARKPDVSVSGTVTVEGPQPEQMDMQIGLPSPRGMGRNGNAIVGPDGKFDLGPGPAEVSQLQIFNVPAGRYVKSILFGGREIKTGAIDLTSGSSATLNIILGADSGEVDGKVQTASGQPASAKVTVAPTAEYSARADLYKESFTDASGNFQIKDMAPGEYKIFAWEDDPDLSTSSAEFRKPFEDRSVSVSVGPKEKASVQVNLITVDDMAKGVSKLP